MTQRPGAAITWRSRRPHTWWARLPLSAEASAGLSATAPTRGLSMLCHMGWLQLPHRRAAGFQDTSHDQGHHLHSQQPCSIASAVYSPLKFKRKKAWPPFLMAGPGSGSHGGKRVCDGRCRCSRFVTCSLPQEGSGRDTGGTGNQGTSSAPSRLPQVASNIPKSGQPDLRVRAASEASPLRRQHTNLGGNRMFLVKIGARSTPAPWSHYRPTAL